MLPFLSHQIEEQKAVDSCGFATIPYGVHVFGNPAHLFIPKIENLSVIKHTPCRLRRRCTRKFCPFYHPSRSSLPAAPQPDSRHIMMNQGFPDPPILGSDTGITRKNEDCVSIRGHLASKLPPSLESHATSATGRHIFKGACRRRRRRHPPASIRPLSNVHYLYPFAIVS